MKPKTETKNNDSMYVVEYAVTADSRCQAFNCPDKHINKDDLRVGKLTKSKYGTTKYNTEDAMIPKWHHSSCMFAELVKSRPSTHVIASPKDFRVGWDDLKKDDQKELQKLMKNLVKEREEIQKEKEKEKKRKKSKKDEEDSGSEQDQPISKKAKVKKVLPSESLVQAAFSHEVWMRFFSFLPLKDLLNSSLVSHICHKASREILLQTTGVSIRDETHAPPTSIAPKIVKLTASNMRKFEILPQFTNLTSLTISGSYNNSLSTSLPLFTKLTHLQLEWLSINSSQQTEPLIKILENYKSLTSLHIYGCQSVVYAGTKRNYMEHYANFTNLTSLTLSHTTSDKAVDTCHNFTKLQNLTSLDLTRTPIAPGWISVFKEMKNLTSLSVLVPRKSELSGEVGVYDFSSLAQITRFKIGNDQKNHVGLPPNLLSINCDLWEEAPPMPATLQQAYFTLRVREWSLSDFTTIPNAARIHLYCSLTLLPKIHPSVLRRIDTLELHQSSWPKNLTIIELLASITGTSSKEDEKEKDKANEKTKGKGKKEEEEKEKEIAEKSNIPRRIILNLHTSSCGYKKKVYAVVEEIRAKANILMVNYEQ